MAGVSLLVAAGPVSDAVMMGFTISFLLKTLRGHTPPEASSFVYVLLDNVHYHHHVAVLLRC